MSSPRRFPRLLNQKKMKRPASLVVAVMVVFALTGSSAHTASAAATSAVAHTASAVTWDIAMWDADALGGINLQVFSMALEAAAAAVERHEAADPATLTVIDYSLPSTKKRMWVYDLRSHALLFEELVSHGRGSGRTLATSFSNDPDSHKSSLGLFRTGEAYVGSNGYSLRLDGLDRGLNDRARERAIVVHGAPYVNAAAALANGYLGRSWGCPAVRPEIARRLIDAVKGGGLLYAYGAPTR